jgi:hypothetical protein
MGEYYLPPDFNTVPKGQTGGKEKQTRSTRCSKDSYDCCKLHYDESMRQMYQSVKKRNMAHWNPGDLRNYGYIDQSDNTIMVPEKGLFEDIHQDGFTAPRAKRFASDPRYGRAGHLHHLTSNGGKDLLKHNKQSKRLTRRQKKDKETLDNTAGADKLDQRLKGMVLASPSVFMKDRVHGTAIESVSVDEEGKPSIVATSTLNLGLDRFRISQRIRNEQREEAGLPIIPGNTMFGEEAKHVISSFMSFGHMMFPGDVCLQAVYNDNDGSWSAEFNLETQIDQRKAVDEKKLQIARDMNHREVLRVMTKLESEDSTSMNPEARKTRYFGKGKEPPFGFHLKISHRRRIRKEDESDSEGAEPTELIPENSMCKDSMVYLEMTEKGRNKFREDTTKKALKLVSKLYLNESSDEHAHNLEKIALKKALKKLGFICLDENFEEMPDVEFPKGFSKEVKEEVATPLPKGTGFKSETFKSIFKD